MDEKFNSQAFGILYEDECFAFSFAYQHTRDDDDSEARDWSIGARISFRTLAGFEQGSVSNPLLKPSF